jgi:hypothetical protein
MKNQPFRHSAVLLRARRRAARIWEINQIRLIPLPTNYKLDDKPIELIHDGYLSSIRQKVPTISSLEEERTLDGFIRRKDFATGFDAFSDLVHVVNDLPDVERRNKSELIRYLNRFIQAHRELNEDAAEGWLNALMLGLKSVRRLMPKAVGKVKQEATLDAVRARGTQANKDKASRMEAALHKAIDDYLNSPNALAKGNKACLRFLLERNLTYGYADATILNPHIKNLFAEKRRALKAEN